MLEATTYEDCTWRCNAWYRGRISCSYGIIIYARDLASMEAQQKAMISDLWNLCSISFLAHDAYIYWKVTNNDSDSNSNMS